MPISNYIPSSRLLTPGVCTSTTRPASPFEGMAIFETDTDRMLIWNGSTWVVPNAPTQNPTGLDFIRSGSLSGTSVDILGCFTTTYDNYVLTLDGISFSSAADVYFQWLSGASPLSGAGYMWAVQSIAISGAGNNNAASSQTLGYLGISNSAGVNNAKVAFGRYDIYGPMKTSVDRQPIIGQASCFAGDWSIRNVFTQYNGGVAQKDGIRLFTNSGSITMSGSYAIYGYRK